MVPSSRVSCAIALVVIIQFVSYVTPGRIVDLMNIQDPSWESHLETSLVVLESNCHENDIPFDREKVKEDLTACLHPIITQQLEYNINLNKISSQHDFFRNVYIQPVCYKISSSLTCLKPHKRMLENCIREDGKAVSEFMKYSCKNNGSMLTEFVEEGGVECIMDHKDLFTGCLDGLGDKSGLTNNSVQVCQYFREVRDCALGALSHCKRPRPAQIIRSIFEDVNKELVGDCLTFKPQLLNTNGSPAGLTTSFTKVFLVFVTMAQYLRPRYSL